MKHTTLLGGALILALSTAPAVGQVITLDPGFLPSGIISSNGANFDNGLNLQLTFAFDLPNSMMSITLNNLGDPDNPTAKYNIPQFGFNAPGAWGTVTLTPVNLLDALPDPVEALNHSHTGGITTTTTEPNFFGGYSFATWVGTANGSGAGDNAGELGIDVGEMTRLNFLFSNPDPLNFTMAGFFAGNGSLPDLGVRIQPMGPQPGSDKWVYFYTPSDIPPPPPPVPEPSTYALMGAALLGGLAGWRRLRRNKG